MVNLMIISVAKMLGKGRRASLTLGCVVFLAVILAYSAGRADIGLLSLGLTNSLVLIALLVAAGKALQLWSSRQMNYPVLVGLLMVGTVLVSELWPVALLAFLTLVSMALTLVAVLAATNYHSQTRSDGDGDAKAMPFWRRSFHPPNV